MGLVGAALITRWGYGLLKETSGVLLDGAPDAARLGQVRDAIESDADNRVVDLHVWRLGTRSYGAIVSLVTHHPRDPQHYKALLDGFSELHHVTVEVNRCQGEPCFD